jgi:hypothetical protein
MLTLTDGSGTAYSTGSSLLTDVVTALAGKIGGDSGKALLVLDAFLSGGNLDQSMKDAAGAALAQFGNQVPLLKELLASKVGDFLLDKSAQTPPQTTLRTLAKVSAALSYGLDKKAAASVAAPGAVQLKFGASASAQATIGVLHDASGATGVPAFPPGDALLQFELGASVAVQGAPTLPFSGATVNASASASGGVTLDARFQWPSSSTVIGAVLHSIDGLASPWDLDEVAAHLATINTQGEYRGLRQLSLCTTGAFSVSGSIGIGHTWAYDKKGFAGVADLNATLGASLSASVALSRSGTFRFSVQRGSGDAIEVDVTRQASDATNLGLTLTTGLVITGIGQAVQPIVDRAFPDPAGLLAQLRKWSAPGTVLVQALQQKLPKDDPLFALLGNYLLGTTTPAAAEQQLRQLIASRLTEQVDSWFPFWAQISQPQTLAQKLSAGFFDQLGLDAKTAAPLANALTGPLTSALTQINTAFQNEITQIATAAGNELGTLLAPFAKVGEDVQALTKAVNADAQKILAPAIKLLNAYEQVRNQVMSAVAAANKLKLGLSLKASYQKQTAAQSEFTLRILKLTPNTRLIYRMLMLGRLDAVWGLLQPAIDAGEIDHPTGVFSAAINRSKQLDLSVYFGDWTFDWKQSGSSTVQVSVDANGMVSLGSVDRFSLQSVMTAFGASGSASFGGTIDIAEALANPQRSLPVTLGFALNYTDKKMQPAELKSYLNSLIELAAPVVLLEPAAIDNALAQYGTKAASARLDTTLSLDADALARLFALTQSENGRQRILATARAALFSAHVTVMDPSILRALADDPKPQGVAALLDQIESQHRDAEWISQRAQQKAQITLPTSGGTGSAANRVYNDVVAINRAAHDLVLALQALTEGGTRLANALAAQANATPPQKARIYAETLDAINWRVVSGLSRWFIPANWYDQAPSTTVALLSTLAQLADAPPPLLVPVLQINDGGAPRIVAF